MVCLKNTSGFWAGHTFFGALQLLVDIWRFPKMGNSSSPRCCFFDFHAFFTIQLLGVLPWKPPVSPFYTRIVQSNPIRQFPFQLFDIIYLVGGTISGWCFFATPLKNDGVKVSWDDDIPN